MMKLAKAFRRPIKVGYVAPAVIAVCLSATSLLTTSGADASLPAPTPAEQIQTIPTRPVQQPATMTRKGQVAPAIPSVTATTRGQSVPIGGIPAVALAAYQRATQLIDSADPTCHMRWEVIGGIGRVESDHGQFGGNHLTPNGVSVPGIYGPVLDGSNGVGLVRDTDGGRLDGTSTYDRAVGPMQFLPGTWAMVGTKPSATGEHGPQNIYDAALATATYLCSGNGDMSNLADLRAAVFRYNHSDAYVSLVLGIAQAYAVGDYSSMPVATYEQPATATTHQSAKKPTKTKASTKHPGSPQPHGQQPSGSATSKPPVTAPPLPAVGSNPLQSLLSGLSGSTTPTPSNSPMPSTQAAAYCANHLVGYIDLLGTLHAACNSKLTGMTPAQASAGWAAHHNDLTTWFSQ